MQKRKIGWEMAKCIAISYLLAAALAGSLYIWGSAGGHDVFGHDRRDALMYARLLVKRHSGGTLFCPCAAEIVMRDGNTWIVQGWAPLRRRYEVVLTFTAENRYRVEACATARCR